jgi:uncharacterized damage-inducible protein DinB
MKDREDPLRLHLARALEWDEAHLTLEDSVKGLPAALRGKRPRGFAHSPWELLEHIRLAQRDLLEFCRNGRYVAGKWPEDYWPKSPAPPSARSWKTSLEAVAADRRTFQRFVESTPDLFSEIPGHPGKTILRSVLLAIDHTAYHVGQLLAARKILMARL